MLSKRGHSVFIQNTSGICLRLYLFLRKVQNQVYSKRKKETMLKYRQLGKTGMNFTELGFGAWAIGGKSYGQVDKNAACKALDAYLEHGGNNIDTATAYGASEALIGEVIKANKCRDKVFLCTKTQMSRSLETLPRIRDDLEGSLKRLGTDHVDLYYLHAPPDDPDTMKAAIAEFVKLKQEGKIRAIGASIKGPAVTDHTVELCRQYIDTGEIDAIQLILSILRQKNSEILKYAHKNSVGIVARTVLESGLLSGKYNSSHEFAEGDHRRRWSREQLEQIAKHVQELDERFLPDKYSSVAQMAIAFTLSFDEVTSAIIGSRSSKQTMENMSVANLPPLSKNLVMELKKKYGDGGELFNP